MDEWLSYLDGAGSRRTADGRGRVSAVAKTVKGAEGFNVVRTEGAQEKPVARLATPSNPLSLRLRMLHWRL